MQAPRTQVAGRGAQPVPIARWTLVLLASVIGAFATAGCATGGRSASGNWKPVKEIDFEISKDDGWEKVLDKDVTNAHERNQKHTIIYSRGDDAESIEGLLFMVQQVYEEDGDIALFLIKDDLLVRLEHDEEGYDASVGKELPEGHFYRHGKMSDGSNRWVVLHVMQNRDIGVGVRYISGPSEQAPASYLEMIDKIKALRLPE